MSNNNFGHTHRVKDPQRGNDPEVLYFSLVVIFCPTWDLTYFILSHILSKPNQRSDCISCKMNIVKFRKLSKLLDVAGLPRGKLGLLEETFEYYLPIFFMSLCTLKSLCVLNWDQWVWLLRPAEASIGSPATADPAQLPKGWGHQYTDTPVHDAFVAAPHASLHRSGDHLFHSSYIIRKPWSRISCSKAI